MCRLFALHAGDRDVAADFWLLDAPDSIARQSEINADGYGLAALTSKHGLIMMRNPVEAASDMAYQAVAHRLVAAEMIVHLRYANTGDTSLANTHPFAQDGRLFAHNGVVGDLDQIEARLGENRAMVMGETDSERFFALITLAAREHGGDIRAGITAAVREVVERYELFSLNFVLAERHNIWAFRYPEANPLMLLRRQAGGSSGDAELDHARLGRHAADPLRRRRRDPTGRDLERADQPGGGLGGHRVRRTRPRQPRPGRRPRNDRRRPAAPPDGAEPPRGEDPVLRVN